jgi:hypothetical protein
VKATFDFPDDLYRRLKARSAMEGRPLRSVAMELFQKWLKAPLLPEVGSRPVGLTKREWEASPWLAITQPYIKPGMSHDPDAIRAAIAKGWAEEIGEKIPPGRKIL